MGHSEPEPKEGNIRAPWYPLLRQHKLETSPAGRSEAANTLPTSIRFGSEVGQGTLGSNRGADQGIAEQASPSGR